MYKMYTNEYYKPVIMIDLTTDLLQYNWPVCINTKQFLIKVLELCTNFFSEIKCGKLKILVFGLKIKN